MKRFSKRVFQQSQRLQPVAIQNSLYRNYASEKAGPVAVVMSGAGYLDGSEITEAVSILVNLSKRKRDFVIVAPNKNQEVVYDHAKDAPEKHEVRNITSEVMRITRNAKIQPLSSCTADKFSSIIFVGGYGVGRNLSDYASEGSDLTVDKDVEAVIRDFHKNKKTMGFMCVSPLLAAKVLGKANGGPGIKVSVGADAQAKEDVELLGNTAVSGPVSSIVKDETNSIISTPSYMANDAHFDTVFDAANDFVQAVVSGFDSKSSNSADEWGNLSGFFVHEFGEKQFDAFKNALASVDIEKQKTMAERKVREEAALERQAKMDRLRESIAELQAAQDK
mmetsp:Transcript_7422/g.10965  ORF Transcript_7422/g.10965 Transcript_7422/m.10965 type:complete len:335 (+) Transcript_7422:36-1040(+)